MKPLSDKQLKLREKAYKLLDEAYADITPGLSRAHLDAVIDLSALYSVKNSDYGDSFAKSLDKYGSLSFNIRAEDKMNRIEALTKHGRKRWVSDESLEDTVTDLAGYAIIFKIWLQEKKELERILKEEEIKTMTSGDWYDED